MTLDAHPVRSNGSSETTESRARSLTEIVAEARKYLGDPVVGEIQAAKLICGLQNTWATLYEHEVGLSWSQWVAKTFGKGKSRRFQNLADALEDLRDCWKGRDLETKFDPSALILVAGDTVPKDKRRECLIKLREEANKIGGIAIPKSVASRVVADVVGKVRRPSGTVENKAAITALWASATAEIKRLGGVVPELPASLAWMSASE